MIHCAIYLQSPAECKKNEGRCEKIVFLCLSKNSLYRVKNEIKYVLWTVYEHSRYYVANFVRCFATREITTNLPLSATHKLCTTPAHASSYILCKWYLATSKFTPEYFILSTINSFSSIYQVLPSDLQCNNYNTIHTTPFMCNQHADQNGTKWINRSENQW